MPPRRIHPARRGLALKRGVVTEFLALCDVASMALRAVEDGGALTDDRPELALAALRRWCAGEASLDDVDAAAGEATDAWSLAFNTPAATAFSAVDWLCLGAQDDLDVVDDELRGRVLQNARDTANRKSNALRGQRKSPRQRLGVRRRDGVCTPGG